MGSIWKSEQVANKIADILHQHSKEHIFGNPFLTVYQIAKALKEKYPGMVGKLSTSQHEVGGKGHGEYNSLAQYVARQMAGHYDEMMVLGVECAFLECKDIKVLQMEDVKDKTPDLLTIARYKG